MGISSFKNYASQVAIPKKIPEIIIEDILTSKTFNLPRKTTVYYMILAGGGGGSDYLSCFNYILVSTVVSILNLIFLKDGPKIISLTFYFINKFRFYKKNNLIDYSSKCFENDENRLNYKKKTGIP
jgi:hypothetical protein